MAIQVHLRRQTVCVVRSRGSEMIDSRVAVEPPGHSGRLVTVARAPGGSISGKSSVRNVHPQIGSPIPCASTEKLEPPQAEDQPRQFCGLC